MNKHGRPPRSLLSTAAVLDPPNLTMLKYFLEAGAPNDDCVTLLKSVVEKSRNDALEALLSHHVGGDLNAVEEGEGDEKEEEEKVAIGPSLLQMAIKQSSPDIVETLLAHGVHVGSTALHSAARRGSVDIVKILLARRGDDGVEVDINARDDQGYTPLLACWSTFSTQISYDVIAELVTAGADVNADRNGVTALHKAVGTHTGGVRTVRFLLEHGADPNAKTAKGQTVLDVALSTYTHGDPTIIRHLGASGTSVANSFSSSWCRSNDIVEFAHSATDRWQKAALRVLVEEVWLSPGADLSAMLPLPPHAMHQEPSQQEKRPPAEHISSSEADDDAEDVFCAPFVLNHNNVTVHQFALENGETLISTHVELARQVLTSYQNLAVAAPL